MKKCNPFPTRFVPWEGIRLIMGIVYFVTVLLLISTFMLIKKTEKKLDVISFSEITIVLLLCYNVFICYTMNFFSIPITLLSLSIINILISLIIGIIILRKKEIQQYKLDRFGLISIGIIFITTILVSYLNFGFPLNIKYETGDPAVHYLTSVLFAKQDTLLNLNVDEVHDSFEGRKIGSYVNSGIIMKCFTNYIDEIDNYKIFILFGIFILFMTGIVIYNTLEKFAKTKIQKILALIISLICTMGYPLNSLLFGFEYMSLALLIICAIIHMVYYFEKEELKFPYYVVIFALLNFNLFCSYYMFIPFMYSALWIYFCAQSKKKYKKIICKNNVIMLGVTLLIPFLLGYIYHLAPALYNILHLDAWEALQESLKYSKGILNYSLTLYGYIYVNFYSNMLLLLPLVVYYIYKKIKDKEILSFDIILLVFLVGFIALLEIGMAFEKVSTYYVMKNYYVLWIVLIYMNFKSMMYIYDKSKKEIWVMLGFYGILILLNLIFINAPLGKGPENENESIANLMEIFGVNKTIIKTREIDYTPEEIEIIKYARDKLDFSKDEIEIMGNSEQIFWEYSMIRKINYDKFLDDPHYGGQDRLTLKAMTAHEKIGKVDYMIYLKKSYYYEKAKENIFKDGEIIFENNAGGIIKYKNENKK